MSEQTTKHEEQRTKNVIKITLTKEAQAAVEILRDAPDVILDTVRTALDLENQFTVSHIQEKFMSKRGKQTLGVVTNRLRGSLRASKAVIVGDQVVSSIGSNVVYMGVHEFGFDGDVQVKAHTRTIESLFGKELDEPKTVNVRAHTRHLVVKKRAPIFRGTKQRQKHYRQSISQALVNAVTV